MKNQFSNFFMERGVNTLKEQMSADIRKQYGLKQIDINMMFYLMINQGNNDTAKDIQRETYISKGHISQSVERLRNMELLQEVRDEKDKRCVHLCLTEKANDVLKLLKAQWKEMTKIITEGISKEDLDTFTKVAKQIGENIAKQSGCNGES